MTELLPPLGQDPTQTYRLGIMGGTFDPIHNGHLVAAEEALGELGLDLVLFMPAGTPAFKQHAHVSSGEDRFAMTLLATSEHPKFLATRLEIDRPGVTYTADTLEALRARYPQNVEFYFITGADAIIDIVTWHDAERIARLATLVGATRPGYDLRRAREAIAASGINFSVRYLEIPALAISSSYLRRRHAAGKSLRYLTPPTVAGYISKHHLYEAAPEPAAVSTAEKNGESILSIAKVPAPVYTPQQEARLAAYEAALREHMAKKPRRLAHSLSVAAYAESLAAFYDVDPYSARVAGLLHDWEKAVPDAELIEPAREAGLDFGVDLALVYKLVHGPLAARRLPATFDDLSPEVLDAIATHTIGGAALSPLAELVFCADALEPTRPATPELNELRALVGTVSLHELFTRCFIDGLSWVLETKRYVWPGTLEIYNQLIAQKETS
jgi:nicotinate-nucleotide adenylyltransferase